MSSVSLAGKPILQTNTLQLTLMLFAALCSTTALAEDRTLGYEKTAISDQLLAEMGMDGMTKVSDAEGMKVRGKFIIAPSDLSSILNKSLNPGDFLAINFAATQSSQIIEQVTLDLSLSQYQAEITRQLGLEHETIDFTNVRIQVTETVAAFQTQSVNFNVIYANGVPVFLGGGGGVRVTGGIFP